MAKMWILFRSIDSWARSLGGPWTGWIGSAPVQISECCLVAALSWLRDGLLWGLVVPHWPFVYPWLEVLNVVWLRRTKETCRAPCVCFSSSRVYCRAVVPGVLVCVHMYSLYVCVYIRVCVYVCGHVYIYIFACVYVHVYVCVTCVCVCVCIFVNRLWVSVSVFSLWTVSCMRMCVRVHMYAYAHVCRYIYMCIFLQWVLHALWNRYFGH